MLTDDEQRMCEQIGMTAEEFLRAKCVGPGRTSGGSLFAHVLDLDYGMDEAEMLVANAVLAGGIPQHLAEAYVRVVREDLPAGRELIMGMLGHRRR